MLTMRRAPRWRRATASRSCACVSARFRCVNLGAASHAGGGRAQCCLCFLVVEAMRHGRSPAAACQYGIERLRLIMKGVCGLRCSGVARRRSLKRRSVLCGGRAAHVRRRHCSDSHRRGGRGYYHHSRLPPPQCRLLPVRLRRVCACNIALADRLPGSYAVWRPEWARPGAAVDIDPRGPRQAFGDAGVRMQQVSGVTD